MCLVGQNKRFLRKKRTLFFKKHWIIKKITAGEEPANKNLAFGYEFPEIRLVTLGDSGWVLVATQTTQMRGNLISS